MGDLLARPPGPEAAYVQLVAGSVLFPIVRLGGARITGIPAPSGIVALETLFIAALGYIAATSPADYTRRVRAARRMLARIAQGDMSVRLPQDELDDLGFLSVSVNSMTQSVGALVREIQETSHTAAAQAAAVARRDRDAPERGDDRCLVRVSSVPGGDQDRAAFVAESEALRGVERAEVLDRHDPERGHLRQRSQ